MWTCHWIGPTWGRFCPCRRRSRTCSRSSACAAWRETAERLAKQVPNAVPEESAVAVSSDGDRAAAAAPTGDNDESGGQDATATTDAGTWAERRTERGYLRLATTEDLRAWLDRLDPVAPLAVDTETDALRPDLARLVGISLAGYDTRRRSPGAGLRTGAVARDSRRRRCPVGHALSRRRRGRASGRGPRGAGAGVRIDVQLEGGAEPQVR